MEVMEIWTDETKLEKIRQLPETVVRAGRKEKHGHFVFSLSPKSKEQIIHILNGEE